MGLAVEPISTQIIPRDRHAMYFATLGVVASSVERLATEIRHLQRTEVLEAEEFFSEGQKGSSAMPHKRNPVLSENLTGLARMVRAYVTPALENVALWHERDISHSSVERMIGPDATVTLDFALARLAGVIDKLVVYPENMRANLDRSGGLVHSQRVLIALTQKGVAREEAYRLVQRNAMKAWRGEGDFLSLLKTDPDVTRAIRGIRPRRLLRPRPPLEACRHDLRPRVRGERRIANRGVTHRFNRYSPFAISLLLAAAANRADRAAAYTAATAEATGRSATEATRRPATEAAGCATGEGAGSSDLAERTLGLDAGIDARRLRRVASPPGSAGRTARPSRPAGSMSVAPVTPVAKSGRHIDPRSIGVARVVVVAEVGRTLIVVLDITGGSRDRGGCSPQSQHGPGDVALADPAPRARTALHVDHRAARKHGNNRIFGAGAGAHLGAGLHGGRRSRGEPGGEHQHRGRAHYCLRKHRRPFLIRRHPQGSMDNVHSRKSFPKGE